jgi:hypothetical protein
VAELTAADPGVDEREPRHGPHTLNRVGGRPSTSGSRTDPNLSMGWIARGWRNAKNESVKNRDLWERLITLSGRPGVAGRHRVGWAWVRGHDGNALNERCDELARAAAARAARGLSGSPRLRFTRPARRAAGRMPSAMASSSRTRLHRAAA